MVTAVLLVLLVLQFGPPRHLVDRLSQPSENHFTEFYFSDPDALPKRHTGTGAIWFTVGLANHYTSAKTFHWTVVTKSAEGDRKYPGGAVEVPPGDEQTFDVSVWLQRVPGHQRVTVHLQEGSLEISFLTEEK
jgi:hypothetical protein